MSDTSPVVVVKVGGSLLDWPELPGRLADFLASPSLVRSRIVLIAGGGPVADAVRSLDEMHGLGERLSHRLALGAMDVTARLLSGLTPGSIVVEELTQLDEAWKRRLSPILAPGRYLEEIDERGEDALPMSWKTTSDSIAARIAVRLESSRLILLKSAPPAASGRLEAAERGYVDPNFHRVSEAVARVECVSFREPRWVFHRLT